eukprot:CAMPEP_0195083772 /NCGR_PEP_ID=MMETSP0448-20130528/24624_1 /TAXON_ID=66468 /ORGANISM="Heterocapsa triquestra, Strain CCMP 448" /LENGTH=321 /DNA_ID=CAMNT_0040117013 /DNA_START=194 /DNA_END=1155 /DNA_ORIENTATION=-
MLAHGPLLWQLFSGELRCACRAVGCGSTTQEELTPWAARVREACTVAYPAASSCEQAYYDCAADCQAPETPLQSSAVQADEVHVVYGLDARHFEAWLASMLSLAEHLAQPGRCVIHAIVPPQDAELAERVAACFRRKHAVARPTASAAPEVRVHALRQPPVLNSSVGGTLEAQEIPASYALVYLHEYMPEISRVLWLDTHTIVKSDVARLYQMPLRQPIAAVPDRGALGGLCASELLGAAVQARLPDAVRGIHKAIREKGGSFLKGGVLLVDIERWRSSLGFMEDILQRAHPYMADLLGMNLLFKDRHDELDWRWNVQPLA